MVEDEYKLRCERVSDINEHLPTLKKYASESEVIVEMGVRSIVSTWALLASHPKKMISLDIAHPRDFTGHDAYGCDLDKVERMAKEEGIDFQFILGSSLTTQIPECDLLFIDTEHTYNQLTQELKLHSKKVRKYIILHDTNLPLMWKAVEDSGLKVKERFLNNNGLTIIQC